VLTPDEFKRRIAAARRLAEPLRGARLVWNQVGGASGQILLGSPGEPKKYFGGAVTSQQAQLLVHCTNLVLDHLRPERIDGPGQTSDD
jgi:hypothetical protein